MVSVWLRSSSVFNYVLAIAIIYSRGKASRIVGTRHNLCASMSTSLTTYKKSVVSVWLRSSSVFNYVLLAIAIIYSRGKASKIVSTRHSLCASMSTSLTTYKNPWYPRGYEVVPCLPGEDRFYYVLLAIRIISLPSPLPSIPFPIL